MTVEMSANSSQQWWAGLFDDEEVREEPPIHWQYERYLRWEEEAPGRSKAMVGEVNEKDGFLSSGLTSGRLLDHRSMALMYFLGKSNCSLFGEFAHGLDKVVGKRAKEWLIWCRLQGVIVPAEERYYLDEYASSWWDLESLGSVIEFEDDVYLGEQFNPKPKVLEMDAALKVLAKQKERGKRVVVSLGNFDVGTKGHSLFLDSLRWTSQGFGVNAVLVGDDHGIRVRKGPDRPYVPLEKRIAWLAKQGVDYIIPVRSPNTEDLEELSQRYDVLHKQLAGIAHMRFIGEREPPWYEVFLRQCRNNGILLVESRQTRISQATNMKGEKPYRRRRPKPEGIRYCVFPIR